MSVWGQVVPLKLGLEYEKNISFRCTHIDHTPYHLHCILCLLKYFLVFAFDVKTMNK